MIFILDRDSLDDHWKICASHENHFTPRPLRPGGYLFLGDLLALQLAELGPSQGMRQVQVADLFYRPARLLAKDS